MTLEHVSEFPPPRPHEPAAHASLDLDDTPTVDSEDELFPCEEPFEDHVAESKRHFEARTALYLVVKNAFDDYTIASDQFFYPNRSNPRECLAPDLMVKTDVHVDDFDSWKTWRLGTPQLAVEIVSTSDRMKLTWKEKFARYEATEILEVVRFDRDKDEPITVWDRRGRHLIERRTNTEECMTLHLFWTIVEDPTFGKQLRLARDREGEDLLPTPDETNLLLAQQLANERYARSLAERERMLAEQKLCDEADARVVAEQKLRDAETKLRDAEAAQAAALEEIERLRAAVGNQRMS
jgi:Uma2 family endonuclease